MLDGLRSLIAIEKLGTVSEAALQLRLTQSAVSKRIQALENEIGYKVVEREGRKLRLTLAGLELIKKARPLIAEFENLRFLGSHSELREFSIGIADSIAASWGPAVLRKALAVIPGLKLEVHVHRSTLIIENIKLGRYDLGLITGRESEHGLISSEMMREDLVLVGGTARNQAKGAERILTIEPASATWKEIGTAVTKHGQLADTPLEFVESFSAAAQMAREGFGRALVPQGIADSLGFSSSEIFRLRPRIQRRIQLVCRKSIYELEVVRKLEATLTELL